MSKCECKNCVHEKVCRIREFPSIEEILKDGCNHYKDKSLFVELPCKVGDEVYYIGGVYKDTIDEATVVAIYVEECGLAFRLERNLCYWDEQEAGIFFTKEEAEKKLKEIEG